ncbi:MAG TPA: hypothetical protein VF849_01540 [Blattabacteriaceae bacterium]
MIKAIFQFLNSIFFFLKRKARKLDDPLEQHKKRIEQIDKDIKSENSIQATLNATSDLDELDRLQKLKDNTNRSNGNKSEKG